METSSASASNYLGWAPIADRLLVRRAPEMEVRYAAGIVAPGTAQEKPAEGEVVAVGPGRVLDTGVVVPMSVKVGDTVLFGKYTGVDVKLGDRSNEEMLVLRQDEVMLRRPPYVPRADVNPAEA